MKQVIIDIDSFRLINPIFKQNFGYNFLKALFSITGLNKLNKLYARNSDKQGVEFVDSILNDIQVKYEITNPDILDKLPEGAFITVSNHPYGALDGLILIDIFGRRRSDFKVLVNSILMYVNTLSEQFIGVAPLSGGIETKASANIRAIKNAIINLKEGHPIGFFPCGAVSKFQSDLQIADLPWNTNVMKLIQEMKVPVLPVYFHGHNSFFYNFLGLIHWKLRLFRLPKEVFNKKGKVIQVSLGNLISVEEQRKYASVDELGAFLRTATYNAGEK